MITVGSKVVCIDGDNTTHLQTGTEYIVRQVVYGGSHVTLEPAFNYEGSDSTYSINRFKESIL